MRMYIWEAPAKIPHGHCRYIAVAWNVAQARELALKAKGYFFDHEFDPLGDNGEIPPPEKIILGEPTRVVELPCAEWHVWSE